MLRKHASLSLIVLVCMIEFSCALPAASQDEARPRNVIMFIADGCGPASFTYARDYLRYQGGEALTLDSLQVGSVHTFASNSRVTDSAAGATALACGVKTYNGAIAVDAEQQPVATVLEAAEARGMATGLIATSRITHATPASYAAHVPQRIMEAEIAAQMMEQNIEVLFGGGRAFFVPQEDGGRRADGRNLLGEATGKGVQVLQSRADFDGTVQTPVLGLFTDDHMAYEVDRDAALEPSLAEMTAKAIDLLSQDPDGFFLMVEGSRIDHAAHGNDAAGHLHDILAYDRAVAEALAFAREDGRTLIVSTSDHETGGLTLGRNLDGRPQYTWHPEVIENIPASHGGLLNMARSDSLTVCALFSERLGIECTEEEAAQFERALAGEASMNFTMAEVIARRAGLGWTTGGHTAVDVNLYAFGLGRDRFIGHYDNTAVGQRIAELLDFDLAALTEALRRERSESQ